MRLFPFILLVLFFSACTSSTQEENTQEVVTTDPAILSKGFQLLEKNCFSCHSPDASMEHRLAPPMIAVKKHYIKKRTSKAEFTNDLLAFLQNPSKASSKMPGAVKRFGLMPKMEFSEEDLTAIAHYIYDTELEAPDWFEKHYQEEKKKHLANTSELSPVEQGKAIAMATKGVLGKNLLGAIQQKGTVHAIEFCNTRAIPLTDSMSTVQNANIKRVSDKPRNPNNIANEQELAYIEMLKANQANQKELAPLLREENGKTIAYYPIMSNDMCLQCHGKPEENIKPETLSKINDLYPEDKAKDYKANQVRGIWVIEMEAPALGYQNIDVSAFAQLIDAENTVVLDVRTPEEIEQGYIAGAQKMDVLNESFKEEIQNLDKNKTYLVYCRSGNRSRTACDIMAEQGFNNLYNLEGGYRAWSAAEK
jgi:rhodanese-related sulfurtransferase/mono/diheme cytochrome c family protein